MVKNYLQVDGHDDLVRDTNSTAIINKNKGAYMLAKKRAEAAQRQRDAIRNATLYAAEVPFETAKLAFELLEVLPELARKGNRNAVSDVGVASLLASAAIKGALFNVDINIGSLPEEMVGDLKIDSEKLLEKSRILSKESIHIVRERLN